MSLLKCLLRVETLQPLLLTKLVTESLQEFAQQGDGGSMALTEDVPRLLLREIRWLEHLEAPEALTEQLLGVLHGGVLPARCPPNAGAPPLQLRGLEPSPLHACRFQREVLEYLPEVVGDAFEHKVAAELADLMEASDELLVPCLDALAQLSLTPALQRVVSAKVVLAPRPLPFPLALQRPL